MYTLVVCNAFGIKFDVSWLCHEHKLIHYMKIFLSVIIMALGCCACVYLMM